METKMVTKNNAEYLWIQFDGERFWLAHTDYANAISRTIILNPREALAVEEFIKLHREGKIK